MKYEAINKKFSDKVLEYLMNGYVINSHSMSGHQGEVCKVDLVKGDELIRIWIEEEFSRFRDLWRGSTMYIRVGKWKFLAPHSYSGVTVWFKDLEVIEEIKYYKVSDNWYLDSFGEAMVIQGKKEERYKNRSRSIHRERQFFGEEVRRLAADYLRRKANYKRVLSSNITVYRNLRLNKYIIEYNGKVYELK